MDIKTGVIAICASENHPDATVSKRFARSNYFAVYNHETLSFEIIDNTAKGESSGAGANAAKLLGQHDVDVVLVPEIGPKAFEALQAFDIDIYRYNKEYSVRDALYEYYEKKLCYLDASTKNGTHQ